MNLAPYLLTLGLVSVILPSVLVAAIGFMPAGVVASELLVTTIYTSLITTCDPTWPGSLAASVQSVVYGAATGGAFSALQSLSATSFVWPDFS